MEVLGIGPSELVMVVLIALIVLGPRDMQKAGRTLGRWLNALVHSDSWKVVQKTSHELRNLPTNLMREANLEMIKTEADIRKTLRDQPSGGRGVSNHPDSRITSSSQGSINDQPGHDTGDVTSNNSHANSIQPPEISGKKGQTLKGE